MPKITMNISDEILEKTDKRASQLGITRTAFITMTISEKLMQSDALESLPEMIETMRKMTGNDGKTLKFM